MAKQIVLDANILIRAVLGTKVIALITQYADSTTFLSVDEAFEDAFKYIPLIFEKRGADKEVIDVALAKLAQLKNFIQIVPLDNLAEYEQVARERLRNRDEDDWSFLALALLLKCPVWTEDTDFFGTGVPTWTSDRVEMFFKNTE